MESFYFLVPIALIFVAIALRFLFWALNSGQYDNLDTEAHRILFDEDPVAERKPVNPEAVSEESTALKPSKMTNTIVPDGHSSVEKPVTTDRPHD